MLQPDKNIYQTVNEFERFEQATYIFQLSHRLKMSRLIYSLGKVNKMNAIVTFEKKNSLEMHLGLPVYCSYC